MKKTNKKGFTIVELVIVIAVIAILAAVLVPNISRLVKKANQSADESLVRNLNTALAMDTEKHTTMTAALNAAYENGGYDVAKIVTKNSDAKILWDSVNDCFVYLNGSDKVYLPNTQTNKDVKDWEYFEICNEMPSEQKYSIYANWEGTKLDKELTVGFDAGKNVFESLTFKTTETRTVIINTNGGALTVEADKATVNHYGEADSVKIVAVASASYHENGKVIGNIEIIKGRIEVAAKAEVGTIFVSSKAANDVKVDVASGAKLGAVAPTTDAAVTDVKASTSIPADAKLTEKTSINTDFAGGLGTENSPYLIATAEQFAKIGDYSVKMVEKSLFFVLVNDIDLSTITFSNSYVAPVFQGELNGNGHKIISNDKLTVLFKYSLGNVTYNDFTIVLKNTLTRVTIFAALHEKAQRIELVYSNVDVNGAENTKYSLGGDNSAYYVDGTFCSAKIITLSDSGIVYGNSVYTENQYVTIAGCDANVDFTMTGDRAAVFCGGQVYTMHITISDSTYSGNFFGANPGLIFANYNCCTGDDLIGSINVSNVALKGQLVCLNGERAHGLSYANNSEEFDGVTGIENIVNCAQDATMKIAAAEDGAYIITAASDTLVDSYLVQLSLGKLYWYDVNGNLSDVESSNHMIAIKVTKDMIGNTGIYQCSAYSKKQAEKANIDLSNVDWKVTEDGISYAFVDYNGTKVLVLDVNGEFANTDKLNIAYIIGNIGDMPKYYKKGV